jgi:Holliday junction resolvase RusA-like endonuclease
MIHRIEIPNWRPAAKNQLINCHWRTKCKLKKIDREMVAGYAKQAGTPNALDKRRVSLEITLTSRQKKADPDAYWLSLLDALVKSRLLIDDKDQFCEMGTVTYTRGEEAKTVIILEDVEP